MILVGIDIGKNKHTFSIIDKETGDIVSNPSIFNNNQEGFLLLIKKLSSYAKSDILIGMEDTGHYHFALLKYLLDSLTVCDVIGSNQRRKPYRITKMNRFDLYEQKQLARHHHSLKEELNIYKNRLQKCIDIVFPEFNSIFRSKYGIVYMNVLKTFMALKTYIQHYITYSLKLYPYLPSEWFF